MSAVRRDATCSVSPDPVPAGGEVTLRASGLVPGRLYLLWIVDSGAGYYKPRAAAGSDGTIAFTFTVYHPGPATGYVSVRTYPNWIAKAQFVIE